MQSLQHVHMYCIFFFLLTKGRMEIGKIAILSWFFSLQASELLVCKDRKTP